MKIGNHPIDLCLLQHYFRNMDRIGILSLPSRQFSAVFGIPGKNVLLYFFDIYHENENIIQTVMMIRIVVISQNLVKNFPLIVLWRKACMPMIAPTRPPRPVNRSKFFSDILRFWAWDFRLSTPRTMKVKILMRSIYRRISEVRDIFINAECKM